MPKLDHEMFRDYSGGNFMAIRFFSDPVRVLSIGLNPIQVLLIRSDPDRVLSIRSDPIRSGPGFVKATLNLYLPVTCIDKHGFMFLLHFVIYR